MKGWIRERRNLIIGCVFTLCIAALIVASLPPRLGQSQPAIEPTSGKAIEETPSAMPARTPAPPDNSPADDLFQRIAHDKYRYFRVSEQNQYWDYLPGHSIWYSRGDATLFLSLGAPGTPGISQRQIDMLRGNIAVTTTSGEPVSFTVTEGAGDQQFIISLGGAPASDLTVSFFSADQSQSKSFVIYYMKPFDYKITAEHIPYSDQAFAFSAQMVILPMPVRIGEPNEFRFQFTDEVDRASVNELFAKQLPNTNWKLDWTDNRTFTLTLAFNAVPKEKLVYFSANGIRNARGVELKTGRGLWLEPSDLRGYALVDPNTGNSKGLALPDRPYDTMSIGPNEDWTLAGIGVTTPLSEETMYELINRKGMVTHTYQYGELFMPQWLPSSSAFVYLDGKSGNRELALYHISSEERETIWQSPDPKGRIIAFDIDETGRLAIAWGVFNNQGKMDIQIEIRNSLKDSNPKSSFQKAGVFRCLDGPCLSLLEFLDADTLLVSSDEGDSILNLVTGKMRQIATSSTGSVVKHALHTIVQLRSKKWSVFMIDSGGKEKWTWSDGEQDIVLTSSIGIPEQVPALEGPFGAGVSALFYVEQKGWFRIDPVAKSIKASRDTPDMLHPSLIVGQFKGKLITGVKKGVPH